MTLLVWGFLYCFPFFLCKRKDLVLLKHFLEIEIISSCERENRRGPAGMAADAHRGGPPAQETAWSSKFTLLPAAPGLTVQTVCNKREQIFISLFCHQASVERDPEKWSKMDFAQATNYHYRLMVFHR